VYRLAVTIALIGAIVPAHADAMTRSAPAHAERIAYGPASSQFG